MSVARSSYYYKATVTDVTAGLSYTTTTPLNMGGQINAEYLSFITEMRYEGGTTFGYLLDNIGYTHDITLGSMSQVVANFDGGNANDVVDAYPCVAVL